MSKSDLETINSILREIYGPAIVEEMTRWNEWTNRVMRERAITRELLLCTLGFKDQPDLYHELTEEDYSPSVTFRIKGPNEK